MGKYLIESNFHVFAVSRDASGAVLTRKVIEPVRDEKSGRMVPTEVEHSIERKVTFTKGMVVDAADIPEGQDADNWVAQGLAKTV